MVGMVMGVMVGMVMGVMVGTVCVLCDCKHVWCVFLNMCQS